MTGDVEVTVTLPAELVAYLQADRWNDHRKTHHLLAKLAQAVEQAEVQA